MCVYVCVFPGASLPQVQVSPQRMDIHEGETLRLYCRAVGAPSPALTWRKQGGTLPPQVRGGTAMGLNTMNSFKGSQMRLWFTLNCTVVVELCNNWRGCVDDGTIGGLCWWTEYG